MPPLAVFSIKNRPLGAVVSHVTNLLPRGREHGLRGLPGVTSGGAPRVELLTAGLTTALQPAFPGASRDRALPPCRYHLPSSWSPTERPRPAPGGRVWGVAWPSRTVGWVGGGVSVDLVRCPQAWSASSACRHAGARADRTPSAALCILGARPPRWATGMEVMGGVPTCPHKDARLLEPPPRNRVPQLCHARTPPNPCRMKLHPSAVPRARRVLSAPNPTPRSSRPTGREHRTALGVQW